MLLTQLEQKHIVDRISKIVATLMAERPFFREELNESEMIEHLFNLVKNNLTVEDFNDTDDEELKEHCSFVMVTEAAAGMLNELTPEQIAIFDEAIKRK
ncbi:MAG TPA: hypothetical protein VK203_20255 [Nostocaceae cyanobacterium]|nr:hypothetical protein [Nostocaceae cyanobacterium]